MALAVPAGATVVDSSTTVGVNGTNLTVTARLGLGLGNQSFVCNGAACDGLDPYATGCANLARPQAEKEVLNSDGVLIAVVEVLYSGSCNSWWAEVVAVQPPTSAAPFPILHLYDDPNGTTLDHSFAGLAINAGNSWTPMGSGYIFAQACMGLTPGSFGVDCTGVL